MVPQGDKNDDLHIYNTDPCENDGASIVEEEIIIKENTAKEMCDAGVEGSSMVEEEIITKENAAKEICDVGNEGASIVKEEIIIKENVAKEIFDIGNEGATHVIDMELDTDSDYKSPILQESINLTETHVTTEQSGRVNTVVESKNLCAIVQNDITSTTEAINDSPISGVKRARISYEDQEPSVHVRYSSLTRASKRKLEELLQQWSEWHARHNSSTKKSNEPLESGVETYFPALHVGLEKASMVSFWMDNETLKEKTEEVIRVDGSSVPLYDRGFSLGLTATDDLTNTESVLETKAARCFNCSSYSHSMRDCPKPRDNVAVNNARKQHSSKRTPNAGPRKATRYYESSSGGKYDDLRPGILSMETRQLLGLGELDPPPWLNRMREIGYPPGYLDLDDEENASGIRIYADENSKEGQEDGELSEEDDPDLQMKMSVEFPGINAPIPENADERRWKRKNPKSNRSSQAMTNSDQRRSRDYKDYNCDGPPGCDVNINPSISTFTPLFSGSDPNYASESHSPRMIPIPRSPSLGRSFSERGRRSSLAHEGSPSSHSPFGSLPHSPNTWASPRSYSSHHYGEQFTYSNQQHNNPGSDSSSQKRDRHDSQHHHRRR